LVHEGKDPIFTGKILMGAPKTPINVVFDTGSDWLVIPDISCNQCTGDKHNSTVSGKQTSDEVTSKTYGSAAFEGTTYTD